LPGDQAAGRIPDPKVRTELLFQQAQDAKRRAADHLARGETHQAMCVLDAAGDSLAGVDDDERAIVLDLAADIRSGLASRAAKRSRAEHHRKNRKRGRGM
jgi:Ca-activated chloride channel homolog